MIKYDSKNKIFYLNTKSTTYAMCLFQNQILVHLYWGKRINPTLKNDYCLEFKRRSLAGFDCGEFSSENMPLEFSTYGSADTRLPCMGAVYSSGSRIGKFTYKDYKIIKGKPCLEGLPATYCEDENEAETLIIHLYDSVENVDAYLLYSVFDELDAITRSVKIVNNGERLTLNTALSATVDFFGMDDCDIIHLDGSWCRERHITRRRIVHGNQNIDSRSGASSAYHNPFMAICDKNATENHGNVYGFSLVYSGNFTAGMWITAIFTGAEAISGFLISCFSHSS